MRYVEKIKIARKHLEFWDSIDSMFPGYKYVAIQLAKEVNDSIGETITDEEAIEFVQNNWSLIDCTDLPEDFDLD
jgi:hypothetical protein